MQTLNATDYNKLIKNGQVIEADHFGDKVIRLSDGSFLKLFRRKRLLSSELFRPKVKRFASNAKQLDKRGIPTVTVLNVYRIPSAQRTGVRYQPLSGYTLRQWLMACNEEAQQQLARDLGSFIARLHREGIYFRSLHMGNVLMMSDGHLGLIDIADMRCKNRSLGFGLRLRNFRHMTRYRDDVELLGNSVTLLADTYNEIAQAPAGFRQKLSTILSGE